MAPFAVVGLTGAGGAVLGSGLLWRSGRLFRAGLAADSSVLPRRSVLTARVSVYWFPLGMFSHPLVNVWPGQGWH